VGPPGPRQAPVLRLLGEGRGPHKPDVPGVAELVKRECNGFVLDAFLSGYHSLKIPERFRKLRTVQGVLHPHSPEGAFALS